MNSDICIIGCGYVGRKIARAEQERGWRVSALTHSEQSAEELRALDIDAIPGDLDKPGTLIDLNLGGQGVYYLAPPPAQGVLDTRMANFIAALSEFGAPNRIVAISTTGVYGDCGGDWIDESRPVNPQVDRAKRRVDMEQRLAQWSIQAGVESMILRVPGIYGPGRLPTARIQAGIPVLAEAESPWSNRIHVDDLVHACLAAADFGKAGAVYNVSDGHPSTMTDYFNQVADTFGLPRPPQISRAQAEQDLSPGMMSYLAESKRIDIKRMQRELGVVLSHPTLTDGLRSCVE